MEALCSTKRIILITGASRGLGRELSLCFGQAGDRIAVHYRGQAEAAGLVLDEVIRCGGDAMTCCADLRDSAAVNAMVDQIITRWGPIDLLINNAGTIKDRLLVHMSENDWDEVIDTNLSGVFHAARAVAKCMIKKKRGHIINISSLSGIQGRAGQANYAAAKAGLIGLTKALARELGEHNIQVNAVLPGFLPTDMSGAVSEKKKTLIISENTLGRSSHSREVAEFIGHLSRMTNVSGQIFNLDSRIL